MKEEYWQCEKCKVQFDKPPQGPNGPHNLTRCIACVRSDALAEKLIILKAENQRLNKELNTVRQELKEKYQWIWADFLEKGLLRDTPTKAPSVDMEPSNPETGTKSPIPGAKSPTVR